MKQLTFLMMLIAATFAAGAQKISSGKVPQAVKDAFTTAHSSGKAKWEKEDGKYEVAFTENNKEMSCVLDAKGVILETETEIAVAELPEAVKNYVKKNYKDAPIREAAKIVDRAGTITYEARVGKKDLMFTSNGNFLKAVAE